MSYLLVVILVTNWKQSIVEVREIPTLSECRVEGHIAAGELLKGDTKGEFVCLRFDKTQRNK